MGNRLVRKIAQFRYFGYVMLGLGFLCMRPPLSVPWGIYATLVTVFSIAWPMLLHAGSKASRNREPPLRLLQVFENLVAPAIATSLQFPAAQFVALLMSLLTGNISQGGLRRLPEALLAPAVGWITGDWARVKLGFDASLAASVFSDLIGYAHLLLFAALISAAGYQQTMRMHEAREQLSERSRQLKEINDRIAKYVGPELSRRLLNRSKQQLPLRRLWISACFVDLVGFTRLSNRVAPEAVSEAVNLFLSSMARLASRQGGRMDKFLGDGVLITFGDRTEPSEVEEFERDAPHCDSADAMLAFAMAVPSAMGLLNRALKHLALGQVLHVRIGGASGYCTVGDFGEGERLEYTVLGPAVNLASRLEALAPIDGMMIDEATHRLASEARHRIPVGERQIKGLPEPVALWRIDYSRSANPAFDILQT